MVVVPSRRVLAAVVDTSWSPGLVAFSIAVNSSRLATGLSLTMSMASPACSFPADGPGSVTVSTVTAFGYFRYASAAYSALSSDRLKSLLLSLSISSFDLSGG